MQLSGLLESSSLCHASPQDSLAPLGDIQLLHGNQPCRSSEKSWREVPWVCKTREYLLSRTSHAGAMDTDVSRNEAQQSRGVFVYAHGVG